MDYSFNKKTLRSCILKADFFKDQSLKDDDYRESLIKDSYNKAKDFSVFFPEIEVRKINSNLLLSVNKLSEKLVLRKCAQNVKKFFCIYPKHRNKIIKEIKEFLSEGTPYRIYKLDISKFFESCDVEKIISILQKENLPFHTILLIQSFFERCTPLNGGGLPRGIEISSVLSEVFLRNFDEKLSCSKDVFYYSRYVDNIFIITSSLENEKDFLKNIRRALPIGLNLNNNKQKVIHVPQRSIGTNNLVIANFNYLGYNFRIVDIDLDSETPQNKKSAYLKKRKNRKIELCLSNNKKRKVMIKVSRAAYAYVKDNDYQLFYDRIEFLVSNRDMMDKNKNKKITTGIYYSNSMLTYPYSCMHDIDKYFRHILLTKSSRLSNLLNGKLSNNQLQKLLKLGFKNGFEKRVFKTYSPNRLNEIAKIWR